MEEEITIIVDQFDNSGVPIMHVGVCPQCQRETILVEELCSLCWEIKLFGSRQQWIV